MSKPYFEFKYVKDGNTIEADGAINLGDVTQGYGEESGSSGILHVFARNVSKYNIYDPGLYITLQNTESRTPTSKPDNLRVMTGYTDNRNPLVSVLFAPLSDSSMGWASATFFDAANGSKDNPILLESAAGTLIHSSSKYYISPGMIIDFWLKVENDDTGFSKDMEDGKWGFSLHIKGNFYGW